jgi:hypothetical protein
MRRVQPCDHFSSPIIPPPSPPSSHLHPVQRVQAREPVARSSIPPGGQLFLDDALGEVGGIDAGGAVGEGQGAGERGGEGRGLRRRAHFCGFLFSNGSGGACDAVRPSRGGHRGRVGVCRREEKEGWSRWDGGTAGRKRETRARTKNERVEWATLTAEVTFFFNRGVCRGSLDAQTRTHTPLLLFSTGPG